FLYDTPNAQRSSQDRRDGLGVGARGAHVRGLLRAGSIRALVEDQLARSLGDLPKLEASPRDDKERIRLQKDLGRRGREGPHFHPNEWEVCDPRLDLDVSR